MGRTSSEVKNRWNKLNYDRVNITIPKGMHDKVYQYAESQGISVNLLINELVRNEMGLTKNEWGFKEQREDEETWMNKEMREGETEE